MGAEYFITDAADADADQAFRDAIKQAQWEYGHGGYTGSLAEKSEYVIVQSTPMTESDAHALANRLIDEGDERINDKWGPAGAIAIAGEPRMLTVQIPPRPGGYPDLRAAAQAALPGLPEDQLRTAVAATGYETTAQGRPSRGSLDVTITGGITGWLFFGWATS